MLKNYLKTSIRNLINNKIYTFINISGLSLGIVTCILIALFVWDEKHFDNFVPDSQNIYRVYNLNKTETAESFLAVCPPAYKGALANDYAEVENATYCMRYYNKATFSKKGEAFFEENGLFAEAIFLNFFGLELSNGNAETALAEANSLVISNKLAEKYFPKQNAVGELIEIEGNPYKITGVLAPFPGNFHLNIDFIISLKTRKAYLTPERLAGWGWHEFFTYIKVKDGVDVQQLQDKFTTQVEEVAHPITNQGYVDYPLFQKLQDIHLYSYNFEYDIAKTGNIHYVDAMSLVAIFIMLIACFNFINLSTAQSVKRAKEVGIRKAAGAHRQQLIFQFLSESFVLVLISVIIGGVLTEVLLPFLNSFTDKELVFNPISSPLVFASLLAFVLIVTLLSGLYPALVISKFEPLKAIKENKSGSSTATKLRQSLVIIQFVISTLMIFGSAIIYQQLNFLQSKDYGFNKERLVYFRLKGDNMRRNLESFKNQLLQEVGVNQVSACYGIPGDIVAWDAIIQHETQKTISANLFAVDYNYPKTLGLEFIAGRDFDVNLKTDSAEAFIINETAVKNLGYSAPEEALGKELDWNPWVEEGLKSGRIIGVVKDFHYRSLHQKVEAAVLQIYPTAYSFILASIGTNNSIPNSLKGIEKVWREYAPENPFDYQFVDNSFDKSYQAEQKLGSIFIVFALVSVFIACFGLFGLISFSTAQKRKEISIRKVLGANQFSIVKMLIASFSKLVIIAACISLPLGYYYAQNWLQEFAYQTHIGVGVFMVSIFSIVAISWFTIAYHAIIAAFEKPVNALRSE
ncbi:ABC transporter permease [Chondrinema litorale]|uniref:ABC transporter permease n=1 Tax=Chondrinema litorale TaxID=2994555 RepID=UPI0025439829|nr:ABC transporter permease [Chondrinema litorale]UZR92412.1 ABC transporter permease [Chondrinema litorale]